LDVSQNLVFASWHIIDLNTKEIIYYIMPNTQDSMITMPDADLGLSVDLAGRYTLTPSVFIEILNSSLSAHQSIFRSKMFEVFLK
jgi:hypothetical protein